MNGLAIQLVLAVQFVLTAVSVVAQATDIGVRNCGGPAFRVATKGEGETGILVLSFDDRNFGGWEKAIPLFAKYDAHATFFVSGPINDDAVRTLKKLVAAGHSAGLHGFHHANADVAVEQKGAEKYYEDDIVPQKEAICGAHIPCSNFAYPNCRRTDATDELFWSKGFARVRGGVRGATPYDPKGVKQKDRKPLVTNEAVFFPASELPKRRRLDTIIMGEAYHTDINEILACLDRIAARKEVMTITSHDIAPDAKKIHMKTEWLEAILKRAQELKLPVLGFDELPKVTNNCQKLTAVTTYEIFRRFNTRSVGFASTAMIYAHL